MENLQIFLDQMKIEMEKQTDNIISQMENKLLPITSEIAHIKLENNKLKEDIAIIENYKRKNNIIIYGLHEIEKSSSDLLEKITLKIREDLHVQLEQRDINYIHRIGKKDENKSKVRPILLSLVNSWKKNEIMSKKKNLKDLYLSEDYSKDVLAKRKELLNQLKEERKKGKFAYIKNNKLIVKEGNPNMEKRKREESASPTLPKQPSKQQIIKSNRINAFDVLRTRSSSLSSHPATTPMNK
ncbi:unnamed protein product [Colias eurytheme]|nr:unnamed protein product [Colias eurytheme]